jgi:hypothetical protein
MSAAAGVQRDPPADDSDWVDLVDHLSVAESLARGGAEAAWRTDSALVLVHLLELRAAVIGALQAYKRIAAPQDSARS